MILLSQWYTFPEVIHMQTESTAEQLKKEFQMTLSKLGHEIRNPIALIVSELQLMASSHPEICTWQGWDSLTDNLDYVRELLNQISDFSHAGTISPIPPIPQISCGKSSPAKNTHWIIWGSHWKVIWKRFPPLFLLTGSKCVRHY